MLKEYISIYILILKVSSHYIYKRSLNELKLSIIRVELIFYPYIQLTFTITSKYHKNYIGQT